MKNNDMDESSSSSKWDFQTCISIKMFILENKYMFPLMHTKKIIYDQDKKTSVYQFQVGFVTHPILKNVRHIENKSSRFFHPHLKSKQQKLSNNCLQKLCISYIMNDVLS